MFCTRLFPFPNTPLSPKLRVQSTLDRIEEAAPTLENSALLRKILLELKTRFEGIDDLLQLCVPKDKRHQKQQRKASLKFTEPENTQTLKDLVEELDRIVAAFLGSLQSAASRRGIRLEDALLAIQITRQTGTDPSLKGAKRLIKGDVVGSQLVEVDDPLGRGSFGVVTAGTYYGKPVAVKRALFGALSARDRELLR